MQYACPLCNIEISKDSCCGISFEISKDTIKYDFDKILFAKHKKKFLLNKVLNNNGHLSYLYLPDSSVSLASRKDVSDFSKFISQHYLSGKILDVGCGTLEEPGYLQTISHKSNCELYGLDPIEDIAFKWNKIIGCAEYLPVKNEYFSTIIFATSIDHVCSLEKTIKESYRALCKGGKLILWHSYPQGYKKFDLKNFLMKIISSIKYGYNHFKYSIYHEGNTVFYIPSGAVDPFHMEYIPIKKLINMAAKAGLVLEDDINYDGTSHFISLIKL